MADLSISPRISMIYELQAALLEPKLKELGLNWTAFQLLSTIHGAGDDASQAEVARRLGITPATLSEAVAAYVKRGLVKQVASASDKRIKVLTLTSKSSKLLDKVLGHVAEIETLMAKGVGASNRKDLEKVLDRLIANLEKAIG